MFVAVRTGLEPATPCVTGMYSNQAELPHQDFLSRSCLLFSAAKVVLFFIPAKDFWIFCYILCSFFHKCSFRLGYLYIFKRRPARMLLLRNPFQLRSCRTDTPNFLAMVPKVSPCLIL